MQVVDEAKRLSLVPTLENLVVSCVTCCPLGVKGSTQTDPTVALVTRSCLQTCPALPGRTTNACTEYGVGNRMYSCDEFASGQIQ